MNYKSALSLILAFALLLSFNACKKKQKVETTTTTKVTTTKNTCIINPLTGLRDLDPSAEGKRPMAVVVQNSEAARPQWGMCSPDIIIEGLAEGGITRMLWLYSDVNDIPKVGSIRSARMDFLEMAEGFDAVFVHCGGAETAYNAIHSRNIDTIDGAKYLGKYEFRDAERLKKVSSEHTVYTTGKLLSECLSNEGYRTEKKSGYDDILSFCDENSKRSYSSGKCSSLRISYSYSYTYTFKYNTDDKKYYDYIGYKDLKAFSEDGGKQVSFTNVIILYLPSIAYINAKGTVDMDLSKGRGILASNGTYEDITWEKGNTPSNTLKLYDSKGDSLKLNAGQSYIGLLPEKCSYATIISE